MKLRNKKTGEIGTLEVVVPRRGVADEAIVFDEIGGDILGRASSISELNEEWEDYEEPKDIWWLDNEGNVNHVTSEIDNNFAKNREIGNYFKTKEEAEEAVEKLKAWKRLKDEGFKFDGWETSDSGIVKTKFDLWSGLTKEITDDLDILFGGEE